MTECSMCEIDHGEDELTGVDIDGEEYTVCQYCSEYLADRVENFHWYNRLTEDHFDRAVEYLESLDEVWCVAGSLYEAGEISVHTPYCHAGVVGDVLDHFNFKILTFRIVRPGGHSFDCVEDHGPCIEIGLDYNNDCAPPLPLECDIFDRSYSEVEWIDDDDKLFELDDDE